MKLLWRAFLCSGSIICMYWKVILLVFANCLVWFTVVFSLTNQIKFVIAQLAYSSVRKYISLHNNCKCIHVSLSCCLLGKLTLVLFSSLLSSRHILARLHFNENIQRNIQTSTDGVQYIRVTYQKFKRGEEVVREVASPPTYGMQKSC